jgi:DNA-binding LacI/PurR family transcriptional regulator/AraC-like DNA-binding protein
MAPFIQPSPAASPPAGGRGPGIPPVVALVCASIHTGASRGLWSGVADEALSRGASVLCLPGGRLGALEDFEAARNGIYRFAGPRNADGVVCWTTSLSGSADPAALDALVARLSTLPLVSVSQPLPGSPFVAFDAYHGMRALVEHLVDAHGLERLAFARGPANHVSAEHRFRAYRDALSGRGLPFRPELVTEALPWDEGAAAATSLLDERKLQPGRDFQALVAASDLLAFWAMKEILSRGWRVPEDLAIAGFNDSLESGLASPAISTVAVDFRREGRVAGNLLLRRLAGEAVPPETLLPAELRLRRSCGCPTVLPEPPDGGGHGFLPAAGPGRKALVAELAGLLGIALPSAAGWLEDLVDALALEEGGQRGRFLPALERALDRTTPEGLDPAGWQACLSVLRKRGQAFRQGHQPAAELEEVFHRARVLAAEASRRAETWSHWQNDQEAEALRRAGAALLSCHDLEGIGRVLAEELPRLGIPSSWLVLSDAGGQSRLVAASEDGHPLFPGGPGGLSFDCGLVLPDGFLEPGRNRGLVVEPLYFRDEPLGHLVLEIGPREGGVYEALRGYVSSALRGARLFDEAKAARLRAEVADRIKTSLFANVSRELCEPLERIIRATEQGQDLEGQGGAIRLEAERQLALIEDLLDLSRADIGELELSFSAVDPLPFLRAAARELRFTSSVPILELPDRLPLIRADRRRLGQVLSAMAASLAAGRTGRRLVLSAGLELPHVTLGMEIGEVEAGPKREAIEAVVLDGAAAGADLAPDEQSPAGSGLGLEMARRIAALHGALLEEYRGPRGRAFRLRLPLPGLAGPAEVLGPGEMTILRLASQAGHGGGDNPTAAWSLGLPSRKVSSAVECAEALEEAQARFEGGERVQGVIVCFLDEIGPREWSLLHAFRLDPTLARLPVAAYAATSEGGGDGSNLAGPAEESGSVPTGGDFLSLIELGHGGHSSAPVLVAGSSASSREELDSLASRALPSRRRRVLSSSPEVLAAALPLNEALVLADLPAALAWAALEERNIGSAGKLCPPMVVMLPDGDLGLPDLAAGLAPLATRAEVLLLPRAVFPSEVLRGILESMASGGSSTPAHARSLARKAEFWLMGGYGGQISRSSLAGAIGTSEDHLGRLFRKEFGLSLWEFLGRYRVRRAQVLLESGDEPLSAIAAKVGFPDQAYFSRVFKKFTGESPLAWRMGGREKTGG